jgi:quercetin dioxygenase-like cupin family protein
MRVVTKGWGYENIFADNANYCGKFLYFSEEGNRFSMHFHAEKDETWTVQKGSFIVKWIETKDASVHEEVLCVGDVWHNPPLMPHQLIALEDGSVIIEVSTKDDPNDNYRVMPGDSQK